MCEQKLERKMSSDRQLFVFCFFLFCFVLLSCGLPAGLRAMTGGDRCSTHLDVALQSGSELLPNACSHFALSQCCPASVKSLSLTETNIYTHVLRATCKYSDTAPAIHRRQERMRFSKMATSSIDIPPSPRAVPQCNLHSTHLLQSLRVIACCTEEACKRV